MVARRSLLSLVVIVLALSLVISVVRMAALLVFSFLKWQGYLAVPILVVVGLVSFEFARRRDILGRLCQVVSTYSVEELAERFLGIAVIVVVQLFFLNLATFSFLFAVAPERTLIGRLGGVAGGAVGFVVFSYCVYLLRR